MSAAKAAVQVSINQQYEWNDLSEQYFYSFDMDVILSPHYQDMSAIWAMNESQRSSLRYLMCVEDAESYDALKGFKYSYYNSMGEEVDSDVIPGFGERETRTLLVDGAEAEVTGYFCEIPVPENSYYITVHFVDALKLGVSDGDQTYKFRAWLWSDDQTVRNRLGNNAVSEGTATADLVVPNMSGNGMLLLSNVEKEKYTGVTVKDDMPNGASATGAPVNYSIVNVLVGTVTMVRPAVVDKVLEKYDVTYRFCFEDDVTDEGKSVPATLMWDARYAPEEAYGSQDFKMRYFPCHVKEDKDEKAIYFDGMFSAQAIYRLKSDPDGPAAASSYNSPQNWTGANVMLYAPEASCYSHLLSAEVLSDGDNPDVSFNAYLNIDLNNASGGWAISSGLAGRAPYGCAGFSVDVWSADYYGAPKNEYGIATAEDADFLLMWDNPDFVPLEGYEKYVEGDFSPANNWGEIAITDAMIPLYVKDMGTGKFSDIGDFEHPENNGNVPALVPTVYYHFPFLMSDGESLSMEVYDTMWNLGVVSFDGLLPTGVENVAADGADAECEYFDLQGRRIAKPSSGLYIVRRGQMVSKEIVN